MLYLAAAVPPASAAAQERELALDSLEQVLEFDQGVDEMLSDFRISGFGVGSYGYRSETDQNSFGATKLSLSVFKRSGPYLSFFAQLTTLFEAQGSGAAEEPAPADAGDEEGPPLETEIDNVIFSVTVPGASGLTFWLGRFDAPLGFERDDEPLNFQPTTSFNFEFARPVKFTGVLASYTPIPQLSVSGYVVNGWDVAVDNNKGKTFGGRLTVLPHEYATVSLNAVYGPEKADNTTDKRLLLSADFTAQPVRALILGGEFNYGTEDASAVDGGDADWIGGVVTGFLRLAPKFGVTLRYDVLDDRDGGRTGEPRTLQSFTLAPVLFYRSAVAGIFSTVPGTGFSLPEFQVRAGVRYNRSSNAFFPGELEPVRDNVELVAEGVFIFGGRS